MMTRHPSAPLPLVTATAAAAAVMPRRQLRRARQPLAAVLASLGQYMLHAASAAPESSAAQAKHPLLLHLSHLPPAVAAVAPSGAACPGTSAPKFTAAEVRKAVFEEANPAGPTVGGQFNQCSYGRSKLTASNSAVTEPVRLPCTGTT